MQMIKISVCCGIAAVISQFVIVKSCTVNPHVPQWLLSPYRCFGGCKRSLFGGSTGQIPLVINTQPPVCYGAWSDDDWCFSYSRWCFFHSKVFGYEWVRKNYCMSLFWREVSSRIPAAFMTWLTVITTCPTNSTGPKDIQPLKWLEQGVKKEPFRDGKTHLIIPTQDPEMISTSWNWTDLVDTIYYTYYIYNHYLTILKKNIYKYLLGWFPLLNLIFVLWGRYCPDDIPTKNYHRYCWLRPHK